MKFQYIVSKNFDERLNLCIDHAIIINGEKQDRICRNPEIEEVTNCLLCDGAVSVEGLIQELES